MSLLTHNLRASLLAAAALATPVCSLPLAALAADATPAATVEAVVDFDPAASDDVQALSAHIDTLRRELGSVTGKTDEERKAAFIVLMREMTLTCQRIVDLKGTGTPLAKAGTFKVVSLGAIAKTTEDPADKAAFEAAIDEGLASDSPDIVQISIYQYLDDYVKAPMMGKKLDVDAMLADAQKKIALDQPGLPGLILAKIVSPYVISRNREEGIALLAKAIELNADSEDPAIQKTLKNVEGLHRRLTIVGKPLELTGTMLDGSELDWSAYRGKVVLVDFFATWCGPCRAEMPHVLEMYEKYKDQGFEVLGISLDDSKENAESYIAEMKLPWKTMLPVDEAERGWKHPLVTYLGIDGIPQAILVDQDGNVVNLNARGDKLTSELKRLLDPAPVAPATDADKT